MKSKEEIRRRSHHTPNAHKKERAITLKSCHSMLMKSLCHSILRDLLIEAGMKLSHHMQQLDPADAVSVLLVYSAFEVHNEDFYRGLFEVISSLNAEDLDAKTAAALYR
jgi:hypothetical protein